MAATVWNWSGKTLSPGTLLAVLYFFFVQYFSPRLDFPSPPLSAPESLRIQTSHILLELECRYVFMLNDNDVIVNCKPGEYIRKMIFLSLTQAV